MKKIKNALVLVLFAVIALFLFACTPSDGGDDPEPIKLPAPTELAITPIIYSGTDNDRYVLVGGKMYVEATVNEGADDEVSWALATTDKATLEVDEGLAVVTGVKGGFVTLTATSVSAPDLTASLTFEVAESNNFNETLVNVKNAVVDALPVYATADFKLPQPENDAVKITFYSKGRVAWTDGIFRYSSYELDDKIIAGAYNNEDFVYTFFVIAEYRGNTLEQTVSVRVVADAARNRFVAIDNAADKIIEATAGITVKDDGSVRLSAETAGSYLNDKGLPTWDLPCYFSADEVGAEVTVVWEFGAASPLSLTTHKDANNHTIYSISYNKPLVDTRTQLIGKTRSGTGDNVVQGIVKIYVDIVGYTPEEVVQYFIDNKLMPVDGNETTSISMYLYSYDKTNKFKKVTVDWVVEDETVMTYVKASNFLKRVSKGTTKVTGTFYYDYSEEEVKKFVVDENGDYVLDENGERILVVEKDIRYEWSYTVELTLTFK